MELGSVQTHKQKDRVKLAGATSTAIAPNCPFKKPKERPPTPFPLPARHRPTRLQKKAQRQGVGFTSCACRRQLDGVAIGTRRNTKRLEEPQRANGAKQRGANGRKSEKCRCSLLESGYRRTLVLDCRTKGVPTGEQLSSTVGQKGRSLDVILRRARRGGGCARTPGQPEVHAVLVEASSAPSHPDEAGRVRRVSTMPR